MIQAERQVYLDELKTIDPEDLIYLDETGVDRKMQFVFTVGGGEPDGDL